MKDFLGYKGKRVIVSGCYSGMGRATAEILLEQGAEVHGLDFQQSMLDLASFNRIDLQDPAMIDAGVQAVGGKVDALFNCAGLGPTFTPMEIMKVNFIGTRYLTERVLPLMGEGSAIASISSTAGMGWARRIPTHMEFVQIDNYAEAVRWSEDHPDIVSEGYAFSKEAIIVYSLLKAQTLIKRGIRINCILPGPTQTPMMTNQIAVKTPSSTLDAVMKPIDRFAQPEEQANALMMLNCKAASYINGAVLNVDGGFMAGMALGMISFGGMSARGS
ncbi:MAG: coniferyl-alcohol dehydrogenase [Rhizomicrobium sp.]